MHTEHEIEEVPIMAIKPNKVCRWGVRYYYATNNGLVTGEVSSLRVVTKNKLKVWRR